MNEPIKVFVIANLSTKGIEEKMVEVHEDGHASWHNEWSNYWISPSQFSTSRQGAVRAADNKRAKEISKLQARIAKLEDLKFV